MIPIYPDNDLALEFTIRKLVNGKSAPLTSGTVTAFLAVSKAIDATAADPSLSVACTHAGAGRWIAEWPGTLLTKVLLDAEFDPGDEVYAHCVATGDIRRYATLQYLDEAPATTP